MKNARRVLAGFYILFTVFSFLSLSGCYEGYYREGNRGYIRGNNREDIHYYRDGNWYRRDPSGLEIIVSALAIGALIESLPQRHTTVIVTGGPYYRDNRYYYKRRPQGDYVVVPEPVKAQPRSNSNRDKQREWRDDRYDEGNRGGNR
jgi:hypothetical protein